MTRRFSATPYVFLAPALVLLAVFVLYPIGAVVYYSFTDWDIVRPPVWAGLDNYIRMVNDPIFWGSLRVTVEYVVTAESRVRGPSDDPSPHATDTVCVSAASTSEKVNESVAEPPSLAAVTPNDTTLGA